MLDDRAQVRALLGREPQGAFDVVVRAPDGTPVVLRNAPLLDDGTPMPTRYWLVGPSEVTAVSRLESVGGVRDAEAAIDADLIAQAHRRYAAERDAALPADLALDAPRPTGGVAGTRIGVKCLHAHYAYYLAGGDDPVGAWVQARLDERGAVDAATAASRTTASAPTSGSVDRLVVTIGSVDTRCCAADHEFCLPTGFAELTTKEIPSDPPRPEELTNAIGFVIDHLDDLLREMPEAAGAPVVLAGPLAEAIAAVEVGHEPALPMLLPREAVEEVFRTLATEASSDRAKNPGLPQALVGTVVGGCCIAVAVMRRLHLDEVTVEAGTANAGPPDAGVATA